MKNKKLSLIYVGLMTSAIILSSCGKEDKAEDKDDDSGTFTAPSGASVDNSTAEALDNASLDTLPDVESVLSSDSASLNLAVSGTPVSFEDMPGKLDEVFYQGALAAVTQAQSATEEQRGLLDRGDSLCRIAQRSYEVFDRMKGGTLCYMKKLPTLDSSTFTIAKASDSVTSDDYSKLFSQEDDDKHVQVKITKEGQVGMVANIKIPGKTNKPGAYVVDFYMCERDDEGNFKPQNKEYYEINKLTGLYSRKEQYSGQDEYDGKQQTYKGISTVTAYLKLSNDKLAFDHSKDKEMTYNGSNDEVGGFSYKGKQKITIDANK